MINDNDDENQIGVWHTPKLPKPKINNLSETQSFVIKQDITFIFNTVGSSKLL